MNLALGGLLIFLLVIPGAVFRLFIIKSESFENPLDTSRLAEISFVLIPSLILHYFGYEILTNYLDYNVRLDQIYYLIVGDSGNEKLDFNGVITPSFLKFLQYIGILILIASCLGYISKKLILLFYFDLKYKVFAISNEWDNLLSSREFIFEQKREMWKDYKQYIGRYFSGKMSFKRFIAYSRLYILYYRNLPIDLIQVDLLVRTPNSEVLYQGTLKKYFLSKGNKLDKIYLKRNFKKEHCINSTKSFENIDSDILVFKGDEIINISVTYLYADVQNNVA
jgi:hypothetical protein